MTLARPSPLLARLTTLTHPRFSRDRRYVIYDQMRAEHPVFFDQALQCWVVTGYAAACAVLKDPRFRANRLHTLRSALPVEVQPRFEDLIASVGRFLLFLDEPDHPRIRTLIHKAFTPRRIEDMKPHMQDVVSALLNGFAADGRMEVMSQFAYQLPTTVIAEMLGVPPRHHPRFRKWTEELAVFLGDLSPTQQRLEVGRASMAAMNAYFLKALQRTRRKPGTDLLSALALAEEQGHALTQEEVLSTAILLLAAGHETTATLVGNGLWLLLSQRERWEQLCAQPELIPDAVEEMLRMESPIQLTAREASEDVEIAGRRIPRGSFVIVALGAANRDPEVFPDPHAFVFKRAQRHLAFSHGPHYCLGAMLARAEAHAAFGQLVSRFPGLTLVEPQPAWKPNQVFRGLDHLHVTWN